MVREHFGRQDARLADADPNPPPKIETLVLGGRSIEVGKIAPPAPFDPASHDWNMRPLAKDVPDTLAELRQNLVFVLAQTSLRENEDAIAAIEHGHGLFQLGDLAAKGRLFDADRLGEAR